MASAWGASFGSAWGGAWGPLSAVIAPPSPDYFPSGIPQPGRRSHLRDRARCDTLLELRCAISSRASLAVPSAAEVNADATLDASAGLRLRSTAKTTAHASASAMADVHDIVLELLLISD